MTTTTTITLIEYIIGGSLIVIALFLIGSIMLQQSKRRGLSGVLSGSGADSYFGKNKAKTKEKMYSKITTVLGILFAVLVFALYITHTVIKNDNEAANSDVSVVSEVATEDTTSVAETTSTATSDVTSTATSQAETSVAEPTVSDTSVAG